MPQTTKRKPDMFRRSIAATIVLVTTGTLVALPGCKDGPEERLQGAVSSFKLRRFMAPGQPIAQALDVGGRALIFLELTSVSDGSELAIDPNWTFDVVISDPSGLKTPLLVDPVLPTAWARDDGVRFVAGFEASRRGTYQIEVFSEDCPHRAAPMVLLPIN